MFEIINNRVWIFFVQNPLKKVHIRELARIISLSPAKVSQLSNCLVSEGLLQSSREGKNLVLSSNYDNELFIEKKKWTNLFLLLDCGLLEKLKKESKVIILFGSYARGEDTEKSDIDIAIDAKPTFKAEGFEDVLGRNIQYHYINNHISANLKENIHQGLILSGVMP